MKYSCSWSLYQLNTGKPLKLLCLHDFHEVGSLSYLENKDTEHREINLCGNTVAEENTDPGFQQLNYFLQLLLFLKKVSLKATSATSLRVHGNLESIFPYRNCTLDLSRTVMTWLPSQKHGGMTLMTGVLQWMAIGSSEGIDKGREAVG